MFKLIMSLIINLVATLVQVIMSPINAIITSALPDLSSKVLQVTNGIPTIIGYLSYGLGLLPPGIITVLLFILAVEIAKHTIFTSTHVLLKVWNIIQKIKFW